MNRTVISSLFSVAIVAPLFGQGQPNRLPTLPELQKKEARFAPTDLKVDLTGLSAGDRKALAKLIEAARLVDDLYMEQVWSGNRARYLDLKRTASTPIDR